MQDLITKWYEDTAEFICENLEEFYDSFYSPERIEKIGSDSYRINPCPMCGHNDSCTVSSSKNSLNCFSGACGWKGTHIQCWIEYAISVLGITNEQAIDKLDKFTHLMFPKGSEKDMEEYRKRQKIQTIRQRAEKFYHEELINCDMTYEYKGKEYTPLSYLMNVRRRRKSTISLLMIGFSRNYLTLQKNLMDEGFTKEEIREAKVWLPEGLFVFPYKNPSTNHIVRMNTKNPFGVSFAITEDSDDRKTGPIKGFSVGSKSMYFSPGFSFKKPFALVEGEHDVAALIENGCDNVCGTGGTISEDGSNSQLWVFSRAEDIIYECFDNDEAGEAYRKLLNDTFPDKKIRRVKFSETHNDIDEYYTDMSADPKPWVELKENYEEFETDKHRIYRKGPMWIAATRTKRLEFCPENKNDKGSYVGRADIYINEKLDDREADAALLKCRAKFKPLNFYLNDAIDTFYNSKLEKRSFDDLISIFWLSSRKSDIIKLLAKYVYDSHNDEGLINKLKLNLKKPDGSEDIIDSILKEVNSIQNSENDIIGEDIPKIKICQYFNIKNNNAYIYFTYVKQDGDTVRKLPFLLRNDKTLIRLDLLKRKDEQCLLLVDNKYELPFEVPEAVMELRECSLTQSWVERYIKDEISPNELNPYALVSTIESYIRKFYFTTDNNTYKILALYIYTTYYYELFGQMPYLFLNGEKGSGKSVLDTVIYLFAFNAKMAIDMSEAALFRMVSVEGGTIILDEMENLTSRSKTQDSTLASTLKGGYSRAGQIYRVNTEKSKSTVEGFNSYCPKVISNIFGLDDVIGDRCIQVNTYRMKISKDTKLEDPKFYHAEKLGEIKEITSKCALSALENFQELHRIYNNSLFETGNARLSQILTPIQAVAKLVDTYDLKNKKQDDEKGEYENALFEFYEETLASTKDNIDCDTPEGIIKRSVEMVAKELCGLIPEADIHYTIPDNHKYNEPINYNMDEGWFVLNALHFKTFIEESMPGDAVHTRYVPKWVKTVFKINHQDMKRKHATITNDDLIREYNGTTRPKVIHYKFYFRDYVDMSKDFMENNKKNTSKTNTKIEDNLF